MNANVMKSREVKIFALVAILAMVFAGAVVMINDNGVNAQDPATPTVATIGTGDDAKSYTSIDEAIKEVADGETIVLNADVTISDNYQYYDKSFTIDGGDQYKVTVSATATFYCDVTFENTTIVNSAGGVVIAGASNVAVNLAFNSVIFDFTSESLSTVYVAGSNTVSFDKCTFNGMTLAFAQEAAGNVMPSATFTNTVSGNPNMDVQAVDPIEYGSDIAASGTTFGTVTLYDATLNVADGQTLRANKVVVAADKTGTITGNVDAEIDPSVTNPDRDITSAIRLGDGVEVNANSAVIASEEQEIIIEGDVTIVEGGYFTVDGKLTIMEGASLTVKNGGWVNIGKQGIVDVQGDLVAEAGTDGATFQYGGCKMTVAGSVSLEGANSFNATATSSGIRIPRRNRLRTICEAARSFGAITASSLSGVSSVEAST